MAFFCARIQRIKLTVDDAVKGHGAGACGDHGQHDEPKQFPTRPAHLQRFVEFLFRFGQMMIQMVMTGSCGEHGGREGKGQGKYSVRELDELSPMAEQ